MNKKLNEVFGRMTKPARRNEAFRRAIRSAHRMETILKLHAPHNIIENELKLLSDRVKALIDEKF